MKRRVVLLVVTGLVVMVSFIGRHYKKLPQGMFVTVAKNTCACNEIYRTLIIQVQKDGSVVVPGPEDDEPVENVAAFMKGVYSTRAEKVLYVQAAGEVEYQKVVTAIDQARSKTPDLQVVLVTSGAIRFTCPESCWNFGEKGVMPMPSVHDGPQH